ncbi:MAG: serine/threonine-protein phosphatase [Treponema sp.]|nr:serine/threonine-protein phosphatase [Treponema sp.]
MKVSIITKQVILSIAFGGILLCSFLTLASYMAFTRQFRKQYDASIQSISEAARECLTPDDFSQYLITKEKNEAHGVAEKILQDFVDKFDLTLLYVSTVDAPDYTHITYLYNIVKKNSKYKPFPFCYEEDYINKEYNEAARRVFENGESVVSHTFSIRNGSHITAKIPVYDSNGRIVAVLGAQKNVQEFVDTRTSFLKFIIIIELIFAFVFISIFSFYFRKFFINPILFITNETKHFSTYGGKASDSLLTISNKDEIGVLARSLHKMERDICNNIEELTRVTAENERISTELSVAAKIQSDMLNKKYPPFPQRTDFDLFGSMTPAKEVGGDLYDYLMIDDDHLLLTVGDVSGKGVPAALFMGKSKVLIDFYAMLGLSPKEIFERTNTQLCRGNDSGLFVTCWLGIFTFSTGELRFVNAGHPFPVLFQNGTFSYLKSTPNLMLGSIEGIEYTEYTINLNKGDRLFIYTDGVTEATDTQNRLFGEERLLKSMTGTNELSVPDTFKKVRMDIDNFVGEAEQFDDTTMVQFVLK